MPCERKRAFTSKAKARKKLIELGSRGVAVRRIYFCTHCHYWHMTSQPQRTEIRS